MNDICTAFAESSTASGTPSRSAGSSASAKTRLAQKIGDDARKWRFEARVLPVEMRRDKPEPALTVELQRKDTELKRLKRSLRHGHWVKPVPGDGENYCSVCKAQQPWFQYEGYQEYDFCPNCGAKMDEEASG